MEKIARKVGERIVRTNRVVSPVESRFPFREPVQDTRRICGNCEYYCTFSCELYGEGNSISDYADETACGEFSLY